MNTHPREEKGRKNRMGELGRTGSYLRRLYKRNGYHNVGLRMN